MFDNVQVQAYGDVHDLSDLAQTIVRGESNVLISVFDEATKESVMKAMILYDPELECSVEGKYISVKMGKTKAENRDSIIAEAKAKHIDFKANLGHERNKALGTLKELENILPMDDIDIFRDQMEESYKEFQKKGQDQLDKKVADIKRTK